MDNNEKVSDGKDICILVLVLVKNKSLLVCMRNRVWGRENFIKAKIFKLNIPIKVS